MVSKDFLELAGQYFLPVFKRIPVNIVRGEGSYLFDANGKKYLDLASGLGVNALGYNHPEVNKAIEEQLKRNMHLSNFFVQDVQIELMKILLESFSEGGLGFFSNSGTESVEGALKLVKKWAKANGKSEILAMKSGFHGRTTGAVSVTMQEKYQKPFIPLLPNTCALEFNSIKNLDECIDEQTAAVFFEPIQGEGGVRPVSKAYIDHLYLLKEKYGFLVIADEIQTGIGRTGKMFAYEHSNFIPDIVCFAKAVGGGLPLGGFMVSRELTEVFAPGEHGTTFGGNPLACAAGLAVVKHLLEDNFEHINQMGKVLSDKLAEWKEKYSAITANRGMGLMQGIEIPNGVKMIQDEALKKGLILNSAGGGKVIRFLPPLIITEDELNFAFPIIEELISNL